MALLSLIFLVIGTWTSPVLARYYDRVLLSEVQTLTFYKDRQTTGRRSSPRPQIECRKGCDSYFPEEMQCYNRFISGGSDGFDVNWECKANLPDRVQLSNVVVGCEGYDNPNDPYILRGSCQVIVSLKGGSDYSGKRAYHQSNSARGGMSIWTLLLSLGFVYIVYKIFQHFQSQQYPQQYSQYSSPPPPPAYGWNSFNSWGSPFGFGGYQNSFFSNLGWLGFFSALMPRRSPYSFNRFGHRPFGRRRMWGHSYGTNSMGFSNSYDRRNGGSTQSSFATTERR